MIGRTLNVQPLKRDLLMYSQTRPNMLPLKTIHTVPNRAQDNLPGHMALFTDIGKGREAFPRDTCQNVVLCHMKDYSHEYFN